MREIHSTRRLELVHSDVCGPELIVGHKYFITFIDHYSQCCVVYQKQEVFDKFKEFEANAMNECGQRIGALHTDKDGMYQSNTT